MKFFLLLVLLAFAMCAPAIAPNDYAGSLVTSQKCVAADTAAVQTVLDTLLSNTPPDAGTPSSLPCPR